MVCIYVVWCVACVCVCMCVVYCVFRIGQLISICCVCLMCIYVIWCVNCVCLVSIWCMDVYVYFMCCIMCDVLM